MRRLLLLLLWPISWYNRLLRPAHIPLFRSDAEVARIRHLAELNALRARIDRRQRELDQALYTAAALGKFRQRGELAERTLALARLTGKVPA